MRNSEQKISGSKMEVGIIVQAIENSNSVQELDFSGIKSLGYLVLISQQMRLAMQGQN
jgi:hypothetical protein